MATLSESIKELKSDPKKMGMVALLAVILSLALYLNWESISPLIGVSSMGGGNRSASLDELQTKMQQRDVAIQRFVRTVQPRSGQFFIVQSRNTNAVGIEMQNAVRAICDNVGYKILAVNPPRSTKVDNQIETLDIPLSGLDTWEKTLDLLSAVEISFPNFYWQQLTLSRKGKDQSITLTGTLRIVLVRDPILSRVLMPSLRASLAHLKYEHPNYEPVIDLPKEKLVTSPNGTDSIRQTSTIASEIVNKEIREEVGAKVQPTSKMRERR